MRNLKYVIIMIVGLLFSTACNSNKSQTDKMGDKEMKNNVSTNATEKEGGKILIVYFSHAGENYSVGNIEVGNTKLVAQEIQKIKGGDEFEIVAEKSYDMPYNQLIEVAKQETNTNELPAFKGEVKNISQYDTIFIGGPIWWGTYPQVMFTFFKQYDLNGKTIIPFTTHEGSGLGSVVEDLKKQYPKANVTNAFSIAGHQARKSMDKVDEWLKKIK